MNKQIISNYTHDPKYAKMVLLGLFFGIILMFFIIQKIAILIFSLLFLYLFIIISFYRKKWKIAYDIDSKTLYVKDRKKEFEVPLELIAETGLITHQLTNRSFPEHDVYFIRFVKPVNELKEVRFLIFEKKVDYKNHYDLFRRLVINQRSRRAKMMVHRK